MYRRGTGGQGRRSKSYNGHDARDGLKNEGSKAMLLSKAVALIVLLGGAAVWFNTLTVATSQNAIKTGGHLSSENGQQGGQGGAVIQLGSLRSLADPAAPPPEAGGGGGGGGGAAGGGVFGAGEEREAEALRRENARLRAALREARRQAGEQEDAMEGWQKPAIGGEHLGDGSKKGWGEEGVLGVGKHSPDKAWQNEEIQHDEETEAMVEFHARNNPHSKAVASDDSCPGGIKFMMYATHHGRDDRFCRGLESVVRNHIPMHVLGWGLKWHGLSQKLEGSLEAVRRLPNDCIVVFTDAYDILYQEGPEAIKDAFLALNHSIVFSAECGCWPHVTKPGRICWDKYPKAPTPYRYLNSGQWAARAAAAAPVLEEALKKTKGNMKIIDQEVVADLYMEKSWQHGREKKYDLVLDHHSTIFQALHRTDPPDLPYCNPIEAMKMQGQHYYNTVTKSRPGIFHFNGGGKKVHLSMEEKMWYRKPEHNTNTKIDEVKNTQMLFEKDYRSFNEICPKHKWAK